MAIKALIFDNFGVLMDLVYSSLRLLDILDQADNGRISDTEELRQIEVLLDEYNLDGAKSVAKAIQNADRNTELLDFIRANRGKYKMAMLSNVSAVIWNYYTQQQLDEYFDEVVLSYREGVAKPDQRIYELTCERLGVQPQECVFATIGCSAAGVCLC